MKVDIWSDVMCPFCYIGKRRFEAALQKFDHAQEVEVVWHSYQLDPLLQYIPGTDVHDMLAQKKGMSREQAMQMGNQVSQMAKQAGLDFNFDVAKPANTFDAHRFSHFAAKHGKGDAAEEALFRAYFTEGKNVSDMDTLVQLGTEIGLDAAALQQYLESKDGAEEVRKDIAMAQQIGVRGVPFFVIDNKYGISGAQESATFLGVLNQTWDERQPVTTLAGGESCDVDGNC